MTKDMGECIAISICIKTIWLRVRISNSNPYILDHKLNGARQNIPNCVLLEDLNFNFIHFKYLSDISRNEK